MRSRAWACGTIRAVKRGTNRRPTKGTIEVVARVLGLDGEHQIKRSLIPMVSWREEIGRQLEAAIGEAAIVSGALVARDETGPVELLVEDVDTVRELSWDGEAFDPLEADDDEPDDDHHDGGPRRERRTHAE